MDKLIKIKSLKRNKLNTIVRFVKYCFIVFLFIVITVIIRVFIVEIYNVPTLSMGKTIKPGDYILVNKLQYRSVFPIKGEVSWFGIFGRKDKGLNVKKRRFKYNEYTERGDIICFYLKETSDILLVKRCIGVPGDSIQFGKERIIINNKNYSIGFDDNKLQDYTIVKRPLPEEYIRMGKVVIPKQNLEVKLNLLNYTFYAHLIKKYEDDCITIKNQCIYINNKRSDKYIFKHNYYFVMGDNRALSIDSRHFGPIPQSAIIGAATHVLFSWSKNNPFFISRIFKKIQ